MGNHGRLQRLTVTRLLDFGLLSSENGAEEFMVSLGMEDMDYGSRFPYTLGLDWVLRCLSLLLSIHCIKVVMAIVLTSDLIIWQLQPCGKKSSLKPQFFVPASNLPPRTLAPGRIE